MYDFFILQWNFLEYIILRELVYIFYLFYASSCSKQHAYLCIIRFPAQA